MINKATLIGHVGKDPEVRHLENNQKVATFTLATNYVYKNRAGEKVNETDWHNIVIWGAQAETVEKYIRKGTLLYVEGRIRNRAYTDKDGIKRYVSEILCDTFQMLSRAENSTSVLVEEKVGEIKTGEKPDNAFAHASTPTDDLPF